MYTEGRKERSDTLTLRPMNRKKPTTCVLQTVGLLFVLYSVGRMIYSLLSAR